MTAGSEPDAEEIADGLSVRELDELINELIGISNRRAGNETQRVSTEGESDSDERTSTRFSAHCVHCGGENQVSIKTPMETGEEYSVDCDCGETTTITTINARAEADE